MEEANLIFLRQCECMVLGGNAPHDKENHLVRQRGIEVANAIA